MTVFYALFTVVAVFAAFTWWFALSSYREKAARATVLALLLASCMTVALFFYARAAAGTLLLGPASQVVQLILLLAAVLFPLALFVPCGRNRKALLGTAGMRVEATEKFNQKETVFNIAHVGGYGPEVSRLRWSLQSQDPFDGLFWTLSMGLRNHVDGKVQPRKREGFSTREATREIKKAARHLGADLVGITKVRDDFVYSDGFSYEDSKLETGPAVTAPVRMEHKYIIVLAKEMDYHKVHTTLTERNEENEGEVGRTYFEVARIACGLAAHIRHLGYSARAHHLRNEQVFQVPHAVDAGLGEQGRHNYLITSKYGPRVRLASVTTELDLQEDSPVDIGVQHFCKICRLCETNCPSQSLAGEKGVVRGYEKWTQKQERCFRFWVSGENTFDCSLCLKVCPWNKPAKFVHRVSFLAASRSALARRLLYWMAVVFYGRKVRWKRIPHAGKPEAVPGVQA